MPLEVEDRPIVSVPEFAELLGGLDPAGPSIAPLAAWLIGEPVTPSDIHDCLQTAGRIRAGENDRSHELIDLMVGELERAFGKDLAD